ncbi:MAG TPA: FUSC family protein [Candidatus Salinicoccus stercoripullorum]|uniref:FUSC family protein n=1 Tax=Candidatus Salinicoccus stercoripullorum TaxID=2838756 RepID=A0A9D1QHQ7_9STAP|nr:FUSC family protein [Candidatus Salinicoccus stercoripullorum]
MTFDIRKIIGPRIIKTGISTFLTAVICIVLNLPPIFAVITAIVTIEPTAYASLKKAYVRFPASIIGAFIAVASLYLFGESALTYSLAATLTIFVTYRLKLHAGVLVAALTAVAMVPSVGDAYFYNFFSRLATTTIGLATSTLVNFFILPPKYTDQIEKMTEATTKRTHQLLVGRIRELTEGAFVSGKSEKEYSSIQDQITESEKLLKYQQDEFKYHRSNRNEMRLMNRLERESQFKKLYFVHVGNLIYLPENITMDFSLEEKEAMDEIARCLAGDLSILKMTYPPVRSLRRRIRGMDGEKDAFKIHVLYEIIIIYQMIVQHEKTSGENKKVNTQIGAD